MDNTQCRKYLLTIQHPIENGYTYEMIKDILASMKVDYFCMADEIATTGTMHTHVFLWRHTGMRVRTIQKKFPSVHYDCCYGSCGKTEIM